MKRVQIALIGLAYAFFVSSFFLPAANRQYWGLISGWQAAHFTATAVFDYMKSGLQKALLGEIPSDNLDGLSYALMLSGNFYMCVAPWILSRATRCRLFVIRVFNSVVIVGALLPLLAPHILPEIYPKDLLVGYYVWALSLVTMLVATFFPRRNIVESVSQSGGLSLVVVSLLTLSALPAMAQDFNDIQYLCADWGPTISLPKKEVEEPRFIDREQEIYFLKQVTTFKREKLASPVSSGQSEQQDVWTRRSVYLCKMKPDGGNKTEIKELWHDPNFPVDVQGQSTWMDINERTRKIALAIAFAGNDITGLWTMNLDGSDLKRIITPENNDKYLQAINHPSWSADGKWLVFEEELRGTNPNRHRIARCDPDGKNVVRFTNDARDEQPSFSPDGNRIVYIHGINWASRLYLMNPDGSDQHPLPNPDDKRWGTHGGTWPTWTPDGKGILLTSAGLIDAESGKTLWRGAPMRDGKQHSWGWAHWRKSGIVGYNLSGILFTDNDIKESRFLGVSQKVECKKGEASCNW